MIWAEYGTPPWEVLSHSSPESLHVLISSRTKRIKKFNELIGDDQSSGQFKIPAQELFRKMRLNTKPN